MGNRVKGVFGISKIVFKKKLPYSLQNQVMTFKNFPWSFLGKRFSRTLAVHAFDPLKSGNGHIFPFFKYGPSFPLAFKMIFGNMNIANSVLLFQVLFYSL